MHTSFPVSVSTFKLLEAIFAAFLRRGDYVSVAQIVDHQRRFTGPFGEFSFDSISLSDSTRRRARLSPSASSRSAFSPLFSFTLFPSSPRGLPNSGGSNYYYHHPPPTSGTFRSSRNRKTRLIYRNCRQPRILKAPAELRGRSRFPLGETSRRSLASPRARARAHSGRNDTQRDLFSRVGNFRATLFLRAGIAIPTVYPASPR